MPEFQLHSLNSAIAYLAITGMGKKNKIGSNYKNKAQSFKSNTKKSYFQKRPALPWAMVSLLVTAIALFPMLQNDFTNWDDEYYVINNALLKGPDWHGIFTKSVTSNYHPITILSLAFNYSLTGLDASSYHILDLFLHLINTALVFYFIWLISGKKYWVAFFTAIIFGIHPMHVESVAWVSERKDVLYTLFFLLSLIQYWKYLLTRKNSKIFLAFIFFALSILSKPAAIILPFVLLLLDYLYGRPFNRRMIFEKIPFFIVSIAFAVITVKVQSNTAIATLDMYPLWSRFFFATYVSMIYILRFFVPFPLSAFHPFPSPENLGWPVLISPLFMIALLIIVWYKRKNKLIVFSFLFFIVNLLLVMQIISIGFTIVSERYTYVPYISLAFLIGMMIEKYFLPAYRKSVLIATSIVLIVFGFITFKRTKVWQNSDTLWTDVIKHYPRTPVPRTNRANYIAKLAAVTEDKERANHLFQKALDDCNIALEVKPDHPQGYEVRQFIYLNLNRNQEAFQDANSLINIQPKNRLGYYTRGMVYMRNGELEKAFEEYNICIELFPDYHDALNSRGAILVNHYQRFNDALQDFNKAIQVSPKGEYYLNRSVCYYKLGDVAQSKADALMAQQRGIILPENLKQVLNL